MATVSLGLHSRPQTIIWIAPLPVALALPGHIPADIRRGIITREGVLTSELAALYRRLCHADHRQPTSPLASGTVQPVDTPREGVASKSHRMV